MISFSLSAGKSPPKCFSNTKPATIIGITWRKTVQSLSPVDQIDALKFVTPRWPTPEMSRMTAFLRRLRAAAWPTGSCTSTYTEQRSAKTVTTSGLGNRFFKTRWFWRWWRVDTSHNDRLTSLCFFFSLGPWITASDWHQSWRRSMALLRSISPTPGSEVFILAFDVPSQKCFAQHGNHLIAVRQVKPARLWKKER